MSLQILKASFFKSSGFTLLELVVVFSVIIILSTIGIAAFSTYAKIQSVQQSALQLYSTLGLAKSRASSQVKPAQCTGQTLNGYKVIVTTSTNSYELDVVCSGFSYKIIGYVLSPGITFDLTRTTSTSFYFPIISSGVQGAGTLVLTGYSQSKTITVNSVGNVAIK
jgi:type II secretory pathway pseudopilin PulG